MRSLGETFNVNYFLVSQTNPHIVPALNLKKRFNRKLGNLVETEWKHRCLSLPLHHHWLLHHVEACHQAHGCMRPSGMHSGILPTGAPKQSMAWADLH